jgi:diguanylate cyclase (GGDEF)-like protein
VQVLNALAKSRRVFGQLRRASQDLLSEKPLHELLILLLNSCLSVVDARGGGIFLLDQETQKQNLEVVFPHDERLISLLERVKDSSSEKHLNEITESSIIRDGNASVLSIPLSLERKNINAVVSLVKKDSDFSAQEIGLVRDLVGQLRTAVENTLLYKEKEEQSRVDGLTGLRNRREFEERLEEELARSQRYDLTFSLALVDLDQFKQYNDTKGHLAGDLLLKQIASTIKESVRGSDVVARYGGDEFVVILPETGKQGAVFGCERLRKRVQEKFGPDITASIGVATFPDDAVLKKALLEKADSALYRAKREGKNRTVVAKL